MMATATATGIITTTRNHPMRSTLGCPGVLSRRDLRVDKTKGMTARTPASDTPQGLRRGERMADGDRPTAGYLNVVETGGPGAAGPPTIDG